MSAGRTLTAGSGILRAGQGAAQVVQGGSVAWKALAGVFRAGMRGSDAAQSALRGLRRAPRRRGVTLPCLSRTAAAATAAYCGLAEQPRLSMPPHPRARLRRLS